MNEREALLVWVRAMIKHADGNSIDPPDPCDSFLRGHASANRSHARSLRALLTEILHEPEVPETELKKMD